MVNEGTNTEKSVDFRLQMKDTRENIDFDRRMDQTMILSEGQFIFKQEKHVALLEES